MSRHEGLRDLITEAAEAVLGRRARSLLTMLGVSLGIIALVATIGLVGTAAAQVSARFDALKATSVSVEGFTPAPSTPTSALRPPAVSDEAVQRAAMLHGVIAAGVVSTTSSKSPLVSKFGHRGTAVAVETPVMAASVSALDALRVHALSGRLYDAGHERRHEKVALLGSVAARDLGVDLADGNTVITIAGNRYLLLGIVTTPEFDSQAPLAAIVPQWVARDPRTNISFDSSKVVIRTRQGAAQQVGTEAKVALHPEDPDSLLAEVPPDPKKLRADVETDTRNLFLLLAAVSLVIGAIGIGNTTLVSVIERRHEIGLRRAIGASRRAILGQFLLESSLLGLLGGIGGTIVGVDLTVVVSLAKSWTAAIPVWLVAAGPVTGILVGLLAGIYPAAKAARVEPIAALAS
ncbi:ABC transporter permease [Actinoallomurus sp. CA-142502]|uniref:ABC transporter permease n=1 Tax=Actinoallomurus sp. CA-142502 TaxID=3239885 RepID=UPI003D8FA443